MKRLISTTAWLALTITAANVVSAQDGPKQISGGILNGKAISLPKPEYPANAKEARLEGTVKVEVTIDEAGNVISAIASAEPQKIYRAGKELESVEEVPAPDIVLRNAAERAAWDAKFSPTRLQGLPVKVTGTLTYNFVLPREISGSVISGKEYDGVHNHEPTPGILNARAIVFPAPVYPEAARAVRAKGSVAVQVLVDEGGTVTSATAVSGHPLLRAAAVQAARLAKFSPMIFKGEVVKTSGILTYNFVLPDSENDK